MALCSTVSFCVSSCERYLLFGFAVSIISFNTGQSCLSHDTAVVNNSCLDTRKIPLYIGGMMPVTVGWDGSGCLVAAEYALEQINNRQDILPEYELIMLWNDTQCAKDKPLRAFYDQVVVSEHTKVAILGPSCSPGVDLVAATSKYWNLLTILFAALSPALSDRTINPTVYRTIPIGTNVFNDPYIWLMRNFGWSRVAFISRSAISFVKIQNDFVEKASKFNVSVTTELIQDSAKNQIELLKNLDIRIIFLYTFEHEARQIFCEAYKSALSGPDIVWVIPTWFRDKWWLISNDKVDCSVEELAEMVESSLIIGVDVLASSTLNKTTVAGVTPAEFVHEITKRLKRPQYTNYTLNNYVAYAYDAVWAIALMLNSSATILEERNTSKRIEDFTYTDTDMYDLFFQEMAETDFFGASGHMNFVKGERLGTSEISQLRGQCQKGWTLWKRSCYKFSAKNILDWNMASTSCTKEGGHLMDIETKSDLYNLRKLWSSTMNNTLHQWYVGNYSINQVASNLGHSTPIDVQDVISLEEIPGSAAPNESNRCSYVDFKDNKPLKRGHCHEERPFICKQTADFSFHPIAVYESVTDEMIWNGDIQWPNGKVPADRPVSTETIFKRVDVLLPGYIHIIMSTLAVIGIAIVFVNALFIIWFSKKSIFHRSHPVLSYIILLSCFLLYSSVTLTESQIFSLLEDQHFILLCQIRDIISSVGFTLGVSTLVGKVWLVYKAAALKSWREMSPEVRLIYPVITFFVCIDIACLVALHLCYPWKTRIIPLGEEVDELNPNIVKVFNVHTCTSSGDGILPLFLTYVDKIILLSLGLFLSFDIRQMPSIGDSRYVTISIYNIVIFGVCGLVLSILLENDPINSYLISSLLVICCTIIVIIIMFLPKVLSELRHSSDDSRQKNIFNMKAASSSSLILSTETKKSSQDADLKFCSTVPNELREENTRLKNQLKEETKKSSQDADLKFCSTVPNELREENTRLKNQLKELLQLNRADDVL